MRHYDVADRTRNRFTGQVDIAPNDLWTFSVSGGVGKDDYDDSYFGLQESTFRDLLARGRLPPAERVRRRRQLQLRALRRAVSDRGSEPGTTPAQDDDPNRDWTVDSNERVNYFSIYATPPTFGRNTEARVSYDYQLRGGQLPLRHRAGRSAAGALISCRTCSTSCSSCTSMCGTGCRTGWSRPSRISTSRSASTTSRSTRPSSTASSSPARSCWATSIARIRRTAVRFGLQVLLVTDHPHVWRIMLDDAHQQNDVVRGSANVRRSACAPSATAQDDAHVKKGQEVYAAQKCSVCHAIAGKGGKASPLDGVGQEALGRRHPGSGSPAERGGDEGELDQEAADARTSQHAAGRRSRCARGLHAEPEVGEATRPAVRALSLRHPVALAGVIIATASAVGFVTLAIATSWACSTIRTPAWSSSSSCRRSCWALLLIPWGSGCSAAPSGAIRRGPTTGRSSISGSAACA